MVQAVLDESGDEDSPSIKNRSNVAIWDTEYHAPREALGIFREAIRNSGLPWTPDLTSISDFSARVESSELEKGIVSRIRVTPFKTQRTLADIRNSESERVFLGFELAGNIVVDQGGITTTVRPGDFLLTRSDIPKVLANQPGTMHQALVLLVPKDIIANTIKDEKLYTNNVIPNDKLIRPISACVSFLNDRLLSASTDELEGIFDALLSLLPLALGESDKNEHLACSPNADLFRTLIDYIDRSISNPKLTPQKAADQLGISARYVHKLFAGRGVTFGSYVMARRLDLIRQELASQSCCKQSIAALAYRWGFEDLSTFNRAFKSRFGCTPRQSRLRHPY